MNIKNIKKENFLLMEKLSKNLKSRKEWNYIENAIIVIMIFVNIKICINHYIFKKLIYLYY